MSLPGRKTHPGQPAVSSEAALQARAGSESVQGWGLGRRRGRSAVFLGQSAKKHHVTPPEQAGADLPRALFFFHNATAS